MGSIYDHPLYYDVLFGWNRDAEADFYASALRSCGVPAGGRVLELGCGTGQIALRLAARGFSLTGLDRSPAMLAFAEAAGRVGGLALRTLHADMRAFELEPPHDGAICPLGTLGMLRDPELARHLSALRAALRIGAPYVVDLTLRVPGESPRGVDESWEMERGSVRVSARPDGISVRDGEARLELDWGEPPKRRTPSELEEILAAQPGFRLESVHPECGRGADDASLFSLEHARDDLAPGRALLILRAL